MTRPFSAEMASSQLADHRPLSKPAPPTRASWAMGDNLRAHLSAGSDIARPSAAVAVFQPLVFTRTSYFRL